MTREVQEQDLCEVVVQIQYPPLWLALLSSWPSVWLQTMQQLLSMSIPSTCYCILGSLTSTWGRKEVYCLRQDTKCDPVNPNKTNLSYLTHCWRMFGVSQCLQRQSKNYDWLMFKCPYLSSYSYANRQVSHQMSWDKPLSAGWIGKFHTICPGVSHI